MPMYTQDMIELSLEMHRLVVERRELNERISSVVKQMRDEKMTWAQIAVALETSTQNAWNLYSGIPEHHAPQSLQTRSLFDQLDD